MHAVVIIGQKNPVLLVRQIKRILSVIRELYLSEYFNRTLSVSQV